VQGTEAVVRDIDTMSKAIEGDSAPINCEPCQILRLSIATKPMTTTDAAVSYGTAIGQYLIQILPPARIGRIILDGLVDPNHWSDYSEAPLHGRLAPWIRPEMH
jgi:hypothetical protein